MRKVVAIIHETAASGWMLFIRLEQRGGWANEQHILRKGDSDSTRTYLEGVPSASLMA